MIEMRVSEAATALGAAFSGEDAVFRGCSIDSRTLDPRALFVALKGTNHDGHDYVAQAREQGAAAAMVEHRPPLSLPVITVDDTRRALMRLAANWRERFVLPVVGVTGSNGKTTVKELLAAIFRSAGGVVLATRGNLNNDIGVPLTLLRLSAEHRNAVVEMGANHSGEIRLLARIVRPTVGVITQCGPSHLAGFGSVEGVAHAKGELFSELDGNGTAVINADDDFAGLWYRLAGTRRRMTFGLKGGADVTARWQPGSDGSHLKLSTPGWSAAVQFPLPGRHNVMNALAATAAAVAAGASKEAVVVGLEGARPMRGRLELRQGPRKTRVIDDTYNANPLSMQAALEVLGRYPGRRWLVLGDMGELGEEGTLFHARTARLARENGVERLFAVGDLSRATVESFGDGATHFASLRDLTGAVLREVDGGTVLVKGSRSMHMDRVAEALCTGSQVSAGNHSGCDPVPTAATRKPVFHC